MCCAADLGNASVPPPSGALTASTAFVLLILLAARAPATQATELAHAAQAGIAAQASMQALCLASELILSAVTASNTLAVAQEAALFIRPGAHAADYLSVSSESR